MNNNIFDYVRSKLPILPENATTRSAKDGLDVAGDRRKVFERILENNILKKTLDELRRDTKAHVDRAVARLQQPNKQPQQNTTKNGPKRRARTSVNTVDPNLLDDEENLDDESEICIEEEEIPLLDTLSKNPIQIPVRFRKCNHLRCCDLDNWIVSSLRLRDLSMQTRSANWSSLKFECPICREKATYGEVEIDLFQLEQIFQLHSTATNNNNSKYPAKLSLHRDGSITRVYEKERERGNEILDVDALRLSQVFSVKQEKLSQDRRRQQQQQEEEENDEYNTLHQHDGDCSTQKQQQTQEPEEAESDDESTNNGEVVFLEYLSLVKGAPFCPRCKKCSGQWPGIFQNGTHYDKFDQSVKLQKAGGKTNFLPTAKTNSPTSQNSASGSPSPQMSLLVNQAKQQQQQQGSNVLIDNGRKITMFQLKKKDPPPLSAEEQELLKLLEQLQNFAQVLPSIPRILQNDQIGCRFCGYSKKAKNWVYKWANNTSYPFVFNKQDVVVAIEEENQKNGNTNNNSNHQQQQPAGANNFSFFLNTYEKHNYKFVVEQRPFEELLLIFVYDYALSDHIVYPLTNGLGFTLHESSVEAADAYQNFRQCCREMHQNFVVVPAAPAACRSDNPPIMFSRHVKNLSSSNSNSNNNNSAGNGSSSTSYEIENGFTQFEFDYMCQVLNSEAVKLGSGSTVTPVPRCMWRSSDSSSNYSNNSNNKQRQQRRPGEVKEEYY